jgi:hypothetical protein
MKVAPELNLYVELPFLQWIEVQQQHHSSRFLIWEKGAAGFPARAGNGATSHAVLLTDARSGTAACFPSCPKTRLLLSWYELSAMPSSSGITGGRHCLKSSDPGYRLNQGLLTCFTHDDDGFQPEQGASRAAE